MNQQKDISCLKRQVLRAECSTSTGTAEDGFPNEISWANVEGSFGSISSEDMPVFSVSEKRCHFSLCVQQGHSKTGRRKASSGGLCCRVGVAWQNIGLGSRRLGFRSHSDMWCSG